MTWSGIKALSSASNARIRVVDSASWKIKKETLLSMQKNAIAYGELSSFDGYKTYISLQLQIKFLLKRTRVQVLPLLCKDVSLW